MTVDIKLNVVTIYSALHSHAWFSIFFLNKKNQRLYMAIMNGRINSYHQLTIPLSIALKSTTAVNKHYMLQDLNPKSPFFFTKNMHALMT